MYSSIVCCAEAVDCEYTGLKVGFNKYGPWLVFVVLHWDYPLFLRYREAKFSKLIEKSEVLLVEERN